MNSNQSSIPENAYSGIKIGILAPDLSHQHGWAHYSLSLIEALRRARADLTIITARNSSDIEGLTLHKLLPNTLPAERFNLLKQGLMLTRVRAILRECDVIHALIEPYAPLAAWVAGKRRLIVTGHGSYVGIADERWWPISTVYRRALMRSQLVCVSHYTAKVAEAALPGVRTVVVNNGVDAGRFGMIAPPPNSLPASKEGEEMYNTNPYPPVPFSPPAEKGGENSQYQERHPTEAKQGRTVLAVGAVKARKGTLELVRAIAEVRKRMPDVQCVIIGSLHVDEAYVERVRTAIAGLGLSDCVRLLGHVAEEVVMEWYGAADVFALPSMNQGGRFEGYGLVYLEASAAGLPVIGTTDCGAEDAIDDGLTGRLVPQWQVAERLPGAILEILDDPALAAKMGAAGKAKAAQQTWDHVAGQMLALYNQRFQQGNMHR